MNNTVKPQSERTAALLFIFSCHLSALHSIAGDFLFALDFIAGGFLSTDQKTKGDASFRSISLQCFCFLPESTLYRHA